MLRKYEFTDDTIEVDGHTLYRIRSLRSFGDVKEGDIGGYIEDEKTSAIKEIVGYIIGL